MSKMNHAVLAITAAASMLAAAAQAATIRVPQDRSTIQSAIDAAVAGDTVLVAPGTYNEVIDFTGKAITVASSDGPKVTVIDADGSTFPVASFRNHETRDSVLSGFTLRNGYALDRPESGGGVQIVEASPTIRGNIIRDNWACDGIGVAAESSSALITGNKIIHNQQGTCGGFTLGGGVLIRGAGQVELTDNIIEDNYIGQAGGGIGLRDAGQPLIARNIIRFNRASTEGGGVATQGDSSPTFVDNVVYGNATVILGGGILLTVPAEVQGGLFVNNTVADNHSMYGGSEFATKGSAGRVELKNNIFFTSRGKTSLSCEEGRKSPVFSHNNVFSPKGKPVEGHCAVAAGHHGNMAVDPLFNVAAEAAKAYSLTDGSPAIDAGAPAAVAGERDLFGHHRRADGDGDGRRQVDLGAIEYRRR